MKIKPENYSQLVVGKKQNSVTTAIKQIGAKFLSALLLMILFISETIAQGDSVLNKAGQRVDMATTMRSNGKIYVVVTVLVIILAGVFFYLIRLDRKISRLEKTAYND